MNYRFGFVKWCIMRQKYFIFCFVFLFVLNPKIVESKDKTTDIDASKQTEMIEIAPMIFLFNGVEPVRSRIKMELIDDEANLSYVKQAFERVKESHADNSVSINQASYDVSNKIEELCLKSENKENCVNNSIAKLRDIVNNIREEMSERILYPSSYTSMKSRYKLQAQDYLKKSINLLDNNCPLKCYSVDTAYVTMLGTEEKYSQLYNKIKHKNKTCQKDVLRGLAMDFRRAEVPEKCLQESNKSHPVCKNMLEDIHTVKDRILELAELIYGKDVLTSTEAQAICLECILVSGSKIFQTINELLKILEEQNQCLELQLGEEKVIHSDTGINQSYKVRRDSDGSYSVPLTLKFFPDEDYDGPVSKGEVSDYYMSYVQKCMKKANTKMLGPNGEKLNIVISKASETDTCSAADTKNILIGSRDLRSNSGKYKSDINCPTITHEILHLLGLCDEYQESSKGFYVDSRTGEVKGETSDFNKEKSVNDKDHEFKPAYDCRVTHPDSIMSHQFERWFFAFNSFYSDRSLLDPGHFNSILYGHCLEKNKTFNECSQLAYKSSVKEKECLEKKSQCESQNILGRNKQEEIEDIRKELYYWSSYKKYLENSEENTEKVEKKINTLTERLRQVESWTDP